MSERYGRTELYASRFQVQGQVGGSCTACTALRAGEMLGLLQGQPVVQLSQLYYMKVSFVGVYDPVSNCRVFESCAEHLWPGTLAYGATTWLDRITDSNQEQLALNRMPDAVCLADAPNHKVYMSVDPAPNTIAGIKAAIDAGYCLSLFMPPNHVAVCWDYDDGGVYGLDSRSDSPYPYYRGWGDTLGRISNVWRRAVFTGVEAPRRINPYLPNNNAALVQRLRGVDPSLPGAGPLLALMNSLTAITVPAIEQLRSLAAGLGRSGVDQVQASGIVESMVNSLVPAPDVVIVQPRTNMTMLTELVQVGQACIAAGGVVTQMQKDQMAADVAGLTVTAGGTGGTSATYAQADTTAKGNWQGVYGVAGYDILGNARSFPAYAVINAAGNGAWTWAASTPYIQALQKVSGGDRIASCWYSASNFTVDVNLTDGQAHRVSFYCLDWDGNGGRTMRIDVLDATTMAVLDSRTVSAFNGGVYQRWNIQGHVVFKFTCLSGANAVVSGVFLD